MNKKNQKMEINNDSLPLMEAFFSIQGEGYFAGTPAYFLRIGGCDVGCNWCDVKESWDYLRHPLTSIEDILIQIEAFSVTTVVITGGEPLMWDLNKLTKTKLIKKLDESKDSLVNLRFQKQLQQLENAQSIRFLKREIAQMKTVLKEMDLGIREER